MVTYSSRLDPIFAALGDPVRRRILTTLSSGPLSVTPLAEHFAISRPAVSRHLRVLLEAGLVSRVPDGRNNVYHLEARALQDAEAEIRALWRGRLETLKRLAEEARA